MYRLHYIRAYRERGGEIEGERGEEGGESGGTMTKQEIDIVLWVRALSILPLTLCCR